MKLFSFRNIAAMLLSMVLLLGAAVSGEGMESYAAGIDGSGVEGAGSAPGGNGTFVLGDAGGTDSIVEAFPGTAASTTELRGMWFSYLDWENMPTDEAAFKAAADKVMSDIQSNGMNAIFCHVHSHSDAYYSSSLLPTSKFLPGGGSFDALQYMIDSAHRHGLQFHAWFNPYRVTGYHMSWDAVPADSIVKKWYKSDGNRNVLLFDGNYYLNPAKPEVQSLVVDSIREVLTKYAVDGVQFDDYFYPDLGSNAAAVFDAPEYQASGTTASITQWRRDNVSALMKAVHSAVHSIRPNAVFGVSPVAQLKYLCSEKSYFVDIDKWMSSGQYIDYVLPQIYFDFEQKTGSGAASDAAYETCLNSWLRLHASTGKQVKLYVGLALYKCGTNAWDGNETPEWLRRNDILMREVQLARQSGQVGGFGIYDYQNLDDAAAQAELANLRSVFQ